MEQVEMNALLIREGELAIDSLHHFISVLILRPKGRLNLHEKLAPNKEL